MEMLSEAELRRYNRHLLLPGFGPEVQLKLKAAKVLVIGAGGLGSPLLLYLAAAGVGCIGIVDSDAVDESNLQRQVLYNQSDLGLPKTEAARNRLVALNPHITIHTHDLHLNRDNALELLRAYDVIADGSDNFPTRYLVNDACVLLDKPLVYGAVFRFEGQVSVFNLPNTAGVRGPNYRDLYPEPPAPGVVPSCAEGGVLGVLPGIIGSMQANEVIKIITGLGEPLSGRLLLLDALGLESRSIRFKRRPDNPLNGQHPVITQLLDYELFCGLNTAEEPVKEITAQELLEWERRGEVFQLIDVREPREYQAMNIGAELIPLAAVASQAARFRRDCKVVIHCHSGIRSATAIRTLEQQFGFDNLYNLKGGILAYLAQKHR